MGVDLVGFCLRSTVITLVYCDYMGPLLFCVLFWAVQVVFTKHLLCYLKNSQ